MREANELTTGDELDKALLEQGPQHPPPHLRDIRLAEIEGEIIAQV